MVGRDLPPGWAALFILSILSLFICLYGCPLSSPPPRRPGYHIPVGYETSLPLPPPPPSTSQFPSPLPTPSTFLPPTLSKPPRKILGMKGQYDDVVPKYNPNKMVTLTIPQKLFPDLPNRLQLSSVHPLSGRSIESYVHGMRGFPMEVSYQINSTMSADGVHVAEIDFRPPFVTEEGGLINLNVTYKYCLPEQEGRHVGVCQDPMSKSQVIYASFVRKIEIILGESDKPIYKPGENIHFRFVALNSRQLYPTSERVQWPEFQHDMRDFHNPTFLEVAEDEKRRREESLGFDLIYIEDPDGNRVKEWKNVPQATAFNLSFPLMQDVTEGFWRLVAKVFSNIKTLQVDVKNNVLPRFLATIQVPNEVDISAETQHFNVCAKYNNGVSFRGHYDAQICVCSETDLRQQQNLGTLFENDVCVSGIDSKRPGAQCLHVAGSLYGTPENAGCVSVSIPMNSLMEQDQVNYEWDQRVGFIVTISESDTGSAVTQFDQANIRRIPSPKLDLGIDSTYRPGLPIYAKVRLTEINTAMRVPSAKAKLELFEKVNDCYSSNPMNLKLCSTPAIFESRSKSLTTNNFNKHSMMPGERVGLRISIPTARSIDTYGVDNCCMLRLVDTSLKNFEKFKDTFIDLNTYTKELQNDHHSYYSDKSMDSTSTAFDAIGLKFIDSRPPRTEFDEYTPCPEPTMEEVWPTATGFIPVCETAGTNVNVKPRVRDFFPEVWLFDIVTLNQAGQYKALLTAPDSMTSWEFTSLCFTPNLGIWMPPRLEPETITISLPFYVEFTPPVKAKRHEILHLPGIEAEIIVGGELCISDGRKSLEEEMRLDLPEHTVEGSLRSYVSVSGDVLAKPMNNLDNLVKLPTGCGEQNMVKVAPSVYVLKYLVAATDLQEPDIKKLAQAAIKYIISGYTNQLNYRHDNGSFAVFLSWKPDSTWLTAFVFGVFSEAERLLQEKALENLRTVDVTFESPLSTSFKSLKAMQREDGCFVEYGRVFQLALQAFGSSPRANGLKDLLLTLYVLSALVEAPVALKEDKSQPYSNALESASRTEYQSISELRPIIRWLLTQQNERGGFYSTQDTVVALRALAHAANWLQISAGREAQAVVTTSILPGGLKTEGIVVNRSNVHISQQVGLGYHNPEASMEVKWEVSDPGNAICVLVQLSVLFNVPNHEPDPDIENYPFSISVRIIQAEESTAKCTQPKTAVCVRLSEQTVNSNEPIPEGMILLTFKLPTGWKINCADLEKLRYPGLSSVECDAQKQELFAYFDGFTDSEAEHIGGCEKMARCISPTLKQSVFVEDLKASLIRLQYYYAPEQKTEIPIRLNTYKIYWQSRFSAADKHD
ncbi:unnamed protein product [Dibothriocephalus latus]|uniref:Alpha-2-macroglobulin domain-containing protein n=1 Tax=Dibothriocephalus latus TaxID=60516 RepID=A0A3P7LMR3_DIBLA|nr:unnamed protein product [Dibothriocephalus latus]